jgi:hypothetical protein
LTNQSKKNKKNMAAGSLPWFLCALLPVYVSGGLHFTAWLADIVKEKGVDQFETDYRWTEISGGGGMS